MTNAIPQVDNNPLAIGKNPAGSDRYYNGNIDDIRIYNRALSEDEIQALYHEGGWTGK